MTNPGDNSVREPSPEKNEKRKMSEWRNLALHALDPATHEGKRHDSLAFNLEESRVRIENALQVMQPLGLWIGGSIRMVQTTILLYQMGEMGCVR
jgi:hypothetical protein